MKAEFKVIEDRGCGIRYTRFAGTKEECAKWIKTHCEECVPGVYIPAPSEWEDNSRWTYYINDSNGDFVPVE